MAAILPLLRVTSLIMISWLAWWLVFAGWGILLLRACGRRVRGAQQWIGAFWVGWSLTLPFLTVWHFFRRVDGAAVAVVIAIGLGGLGTRRLRIADCRLRIDNFRITGIVIFIALAFLAADHCLLPPCNFDTGLYHLQAMRWIELYAIVPGLGNLHGRLAFNQSYFLYAALLDTGPWHGVAHYWMSGLFPLTLIAQLMLKLAAPRRGYENATRRLFWLLLAVPVVSQVNNVNLAAPSPDLPLFTLALTLALELLDLLLLAPAATRGVPSRVMKIVIIALAGITVKFSFVALGALAAALALGVGVARLWRRRQRVVVRLLCGTALCGAAILIPWAARDLLLSGHVGYPLPWLTLPLPWRVPLPAVRAEMIEIRGLACDPREVFKPWPVRGWGWIPRWASYMNTFQKFDLFLPLGMVALAMAMALWQRRRGIAPVGSRSMWLFLALPIPALLFWFFTAPHPRFAGGLFWILAAGANAFILARFGTRLRVALAVGMVLLSALFAAPTLPFQWPGPERGFPAIPRVEAVPFVTDSGLRLLTSADGWLCWDMPLPCTPYPKRGLRLIERGNVQRGFKIDGPK